MLALTLEHFIFLRVEVDVFICTRPIRFALLLPATVHILRNNFIFSDVYFFMDFSALAIYTRAHALSAPNVLSNLCMKISVNYIKNYI